MNMGWPTVNLGDVSDLQNGFAFKSKSFKDSGTPVLRISNIQGEEVSDNRPVYVDENDYSENLSKYYVNQGDLLIAMSGGTTGKIGFLRTGTRYLLNQRVGLFRPTKKLDKQYLFYFLLTKSEESLKISAGSAQPNLSTKQIKGFQIPLPPVEEQKRIVAILDEVFIGIDTVIANAEKNLANARELFESYLSNLFNEKHEKWEVYELGDLCDFLNGFAFKSKDTVETSNVQLIRMGNLYQNNLDLDRKPAFYPETFADEFERYRLNEGDLIISLTGTVDKEDYGYTVEIPRTDRVLLLNQRIAKFVNIDTSLIGKSFLLFVLRSRFFLDALYASARGVRQANLSTVAMKKMTVSLPSISEQQQIVKNLSQLQNDIQRLQAIYQEKLNSLKELKQSLLQKAFSGELTAEGDKLMGEAVA
ncbi:MAG: restriction endonuclease subunit S [Candidatus Thiodiazotropha lotti]|nr:restriction endonuclease subunit S [Candidatus Thiodiazotropha lotti]MCG8002807.1 restriction endonuclease subunit S [Candidatus Thiodiazotropha lotti]MCG8007153.1 restriction endonuclease subunit S [Candidatus Thiodiazotropha lotti]MCW4186427.1 restriction endonuclease subunit S [Candidatus Thiodiazotropha lotti]MCW4194734.1 restriction endonuclease subunit S [Candidatus Thiodiazotropha lotti]